MSTGFRASLNLDAIGIDLDVDLGGVWETFQRFSRGVSERRDSEAAGLGGSEPLRIFIICPTCGADATHLGSTELLDRKVRLCTRCQSLFEVT